MPYIMNCLPTPVSTKVFGNWYTFTPGQIKMFHNESVARFMAEKRGEEGLVSIPDEVMEMKLENPEGFKAEVEAKRAAGIRMRIQKLEWIKANLTSSLAKDMKRANITSDVLLEASSGEKAAIKELAQLSKEAAKIGNDEVAEMRKLLGEIDVNAQRADS